MGELWKAVLAEIELEVSKPIFLTFFKGMYLVSLNDSVATISAPTHIIAEYIEKRYYALLKKVLDKKTGKNLSLLFVSDSKKEPFKKESVGPLFAKDIPTPLPKPRLTRIRKDYTFEEFAVSESNQLAYTAATTVADHPGEKYNPLFIYGTVGVGKTHLMHAVANKAATAQNGVHVLCLTTEEFTNEVVEAIRDKTTTQLRRKFRNTDLLLLDDIQFLSGKERVQEELFHTFNTLIDKGKQVIFSSDRPPSEIKKIEARLASRFEGGLTVDIQPPDFELRAAILLIKSKKYQFLLDIDSAKLIAEKIKDTRALEGFLLRLMTESSREKKEASQDFILRFLGKQREESNVIRPDDIISATCSFYRIKSTQLKGLRRYAYLVLPRQVCMYLLKEMVGLTFVEVGHLLGGRDHTTVMHGVEKIGKILLISPKIKGDISLITNMVKSNSPQ